MKSIIFEGTGICYLVGLGVSYDNENYKTEDGGIVLYFLGKKINILDKRWYTVSTLDYITEHKSEYNRFTEFFNSPCRYEIIAETDEMEKNPKTYPFTIVLYDVYKDNGYLKPEYEENDFRNLLYFSSQYSNQNNKSTKFLAKHTLLFSETRRFETHIQNFSVVFEYYEDWNKNNG